MDGGTLTFVLPASYSYDSIEEEANSFNPPMLGKISGENVSLKPLASFFKIYVDNIPAGGADMEFVLTADKRITGTFTDDLSAEYPVLNTDEAEGNTAPLLPRSRMAGLLCSSGPGKTRLCRGRLLNDATLSMDMSRQITETDHILL